MGAKLSGFSLGLGIVLMLSAGAGYVRYVDNPFADDPAPPADGTVEVFRSTDLTGWTVDTQDTTDSCFRTENAVVTEGVLTLRTGNDGCAGGAEVDGAQIHAGPPEGYGHGVFEIRARSSFTSAETSAGLAQGLLLTDVAEPTRSIVVFIITGGSVFGTVGQLLTAPDATAQVAVTPNPTMPQVTVNEFHTYRVEWDNQEIRWFVDDNQVWSQPAASFAATAVQLQLTASTADTAPTAATAFPALLEVEYVAVEQNP